MKVDHKRIATKNIATGEAKAIVNRSAFRGNQIGKNRYPFLGHLPVVSHLSFVLAT
jgi:hypothetical protein